jgi:hypothetical protein
MKKQYWGANGVGGTLAALTLVVACGDAFGDGSDCKANRTCEATGGDQGSDGGRPDDSPKGGADAAAGHAATGGDDTGSPGGAAGAAGAADLECHINADCSNDDPADGEEVCNNGECGAGNPPPTVVSVSPKDSSADIDVDAKVAIKFSEPLDAKTVTPATIRVLDGKTVVPGLLEYADSTVTFTPTWPLALLAPYTVVVTTGVEDADGAPLLSEYTSGFSTRDGAWTTVDAAQGSFYALSNGLPISSQGDVLVAWAGNKVQNSELNCPITAQWFRTGVAAATKAVFDLAPTSDCDYLSSGGNAAGVASIVWKIPGSGHGTYVEQYRAGAWQHNLSPVSKDTNDHDLGVAVGPSGVVTWFEHGTNDSKTWMTDAAGTWPATGAVVSNTGADGAMSVAYDADGNGLALWRAEAKIGSGNERIVASRFDAATSKWSIASDLPGSAAANPPTITNLRGIPVVAVDDEGDAMTLWVDASATGKLMANRYSQAGGWDTPEPISGATIVKLTSDAPALAFDGEAFMAAWVAEESGKYYTFTARYDATKGWGAAVRQQMTAADGTSALKMPRLVSDRRGNSLVVFATGAAPTYTLAYRRYARGAWEVLKGVEGGTLVNPYFESNGSAVLALSMNDSGLAALSWGNYDENYRISVIRLASFF